VKNTTVKNTAEKNTVAKKNTVKKKNTAAEKISNTVMKTANMITDKTA